MDTDRATEAAPPLDSSLRLDVRNCGTVSKSACSARNCRARSEGLSESSVCIPMQNRYFLA